VGGARAPDRQDGEGGVWGTCLTVGLVFAVLLASGVIFPNPFMPPMVRKAHFFELSSSMLTYGAIAGWVWTRRSQPALHSAGW
jgi:hypothetical protein